MPLPRCVVYLNDSSVGPIISDHAFAGGLAWGDFDNDGFVDMMVANGEGVGESKNFLFHNQGNGSFARVTTGSIVNDLRKSWTVSWADYDDDGLLDLFVTNDNGEDNQLFHNDGPGGFTELTAAQVGLLVHDGGNSTGCAWGDYDNDGHLDLFVANSPRNLLYHNKGDGTFEKVTTGGIVTDVSNQAIGCAWVDYDNDGYLDLFVVNSGGANNYLYHNNGDGTFIRINSGSLVNDSGQGSIDCAWADYDNDGFMDVFISGGVHNSSLFHNDGNINNWINLKLVGTVSNRAAVGAKVRVLATIGGKRVWQRRDIGSSGSMEGQSDLRATFGLGDAWRIDDVRIEWPSGIRQTLTNLLMKEFLTVTEPPLTIEFATPTLTVQEDAREAVVTVSRNSVVGRATVDYSVTAGTNIWSAATPGADFISGSGHLEFAPGETNKTFTVTILDDGLVEGDESVLLSLSNPSNGVVVGEPAVLTIVDNETPTLLDPAYHPGLEAGATPMTMIMQPDAKILLCGQLSSPHGEADGNLIDLVFRLNPDGKRDTTFRSIRSAFLGAPSGTTFARGMALQTDGKVVVGGVFSKINGVKHDNLARLNSDGSIDTNFTASAQGDNTQPRMVDEIVIQPDGKILVGGSFTSINGVERHSVARLNSDGTLDAGFDAGNTLLSVGFLALQPNGKILVKEDDNGGPLLKLLNSDGTVDDSFASLQVGYQMLQQPDGKLLVNVNGCLKRLNTDGSLDPSFVPCSATYTGLEFLPLAVRADGRILAATSQAPAQSGSSLPGLALLNPDGAVNLRYPFPGVAFSPNNSWVSSAIFLNDDIALVAGNFQTGGVYQAGLVRLFSAGHALAVQLSATHTQVYEDGRSVELVVERTGDSSNGADVDFATSNASGLANLDFQPGSGTLHFAPLEVRKVIDIPILDNSVVNAPKEFRVSLKSPSAGVFIGIGPSVETISISDDEHPGSIDDGFRPPSYSQVYAMLEVGDKILVSGYSDFTNSTTGEHTSVLRLNADGSVDTSFKLDIPPVPSFWFGYSQPAVFALVAQPDGKILLTSNDPFVVNGSVQGAVARINPDGTLDDSFHVDLGATNAAPHLLALQPDGKILVAQEFYDAQSMRHPFIVRLNPNGEKDLSFNMGEGITGAIWSTTLNAMVVQPDGNILIAGDFANVGGQGRTGIARLNSDGSLDSSFAPAPGDSGAINTMILQPDGKIFIEGELVSFARVSVGGIARLNPDGSLDKTFKNFGDSDGTGVQDQTVPIIAALQPDGRILVAGSTLSSFKNGSVQERQGVARLNLDGSLDTSFDAGKGFYIGDVCCESAQPNVSSILLRANGSILAGGGFSSFGGAQHAGLVQLRNDPLIRFAGITSKMELSLVTLPGRRYAFETSSDLVNWLPWRTNTASGYLLNLNDFDGAKLNSRFYRSRLLNP